MAESQRPRIVIIGAGFGGLSAARELDGADADVTIIDKRNYHLFQPLLYQVATADLSPADVAWPIRGIVADQKNTRVALTEVQDIDLAQKRVIGDTASFDYDHLVIATGAQHSYFGNDHWEPHAPGLKRIVDATEIRKR
ncbi:MAG: FAD-dependent oxidoreductase, partial [Pseudomonadota bacterium]